MTIAEDIAPSQLHTAFAEGWDALCHRRRTQLLGTTRPSSSSAFHRPNQARRFDTEDLIGTARISTRSAR